VLKYNTTEIVVKHRTVDEYTAMLYFTYENCGVTTCNLKPEVIV
jgi:hypothetical protein